MSPFITLVLSNSVVVALLGLVVMAISRLWPRPAVCHALWVCLLAKLLIPPLWQIPLPAPDVPDGSPPAVTSEVLVLRLDSPDDPIQDGSAEPKMPTAERPISIQALGEPAAPSAAPSTNSPTAAGNLQWGLWLAVLWAVGSLLYAAALARRVRCFGRLLGDAADAPAPVHRMAQRIARVLGLRRTPRLCCVPGRLSPLVWGVGRRSRIVLPDELFARLSPRSQQAVLAHELAHVRRGDPWVRLLETLVTIVYWWNPFVWWARRELHILEELSCDALALRVRANSPQSYATALLDTLDFLAGSSAALPPAASGVSTRKHLKRRIEMVMRNEFQTGSRFVRWLALVAAIVCLPLGFSRAQDQEAGTEQAVEDVVQAVEELVVEPETYAELGLELLLRSEDGKEEKDGNDQVPIVHFLKRLSVQAEDAAQGEAAEDGEKQRPVSITIKFSNGKEETIELQGNHEVLIQVGNKRYLILNNKKEGKADAVATREGVMELTVRPEIHGEAIKVRPEIRAEAEILHQAQEKAAAAARQQVERAQKLAEEARAKIEEARQKQGKLLDESINQQLQAELQRMTQLSARQMKELRAELERELQRRLAELKDQEGSDASANALRQAQSFLNRSEDAQPDTRLDRLEEMMLEIQAELQQLRADRDRGEEDESVEDDAEIDEEEVEADEEVEETEEVEVDEIEEEIEVEVELDNQN